MDLFKDLLQADLARYGGKKQTGRYLYRFHRLLRRAHTTTNPILLAWYRLLLKKHSAKHLLEIGYKCKIGKGLYLGHSYCITVNPRSVIGDWCTLNKGVTIGQENRGPRTGTPTIGNQVWIGANSTVVGKINIGDDVLIAANTLVNKNIPSHSIVIGNPCIIKPSQNATEGYIDIPSYKQKG